MSDRKLVYKVIVDAIEPMDADSLEAARIHGWRCVVRKGEFKPGDTGLFFEIDSALNPHDERFAFLKDRCYKQFTVYGELFDECLRIKTCKLRGVLSQGLLLPCSKFCEVRNMKLGEDCTALLAVRHYDEVAEKAARECGSVIAADQKGLFPSFIPKTDEERIQNLDDNTLEQFRDEPLEVTLKLDGTSATFFCAPETRPDDPFGVCSRNFELKDMPSTYWDTAHELGMPDALDAYCLLHDTELALQGEIVGPGIQNNRDRSSERSFNVFRIWNIKEQRWLNWDERYRVCEELKLKHVPVLGTHRIGDFNCDRDAMLKFAEGKTPAGNEREGLVWKSWDGRFSFKTVSNAYLLGLR